MDRHDPCKNKNQHKRTKQGPLKDNWVCVCGGGGGGGGGREGL